MTNVTQNRYFSLEEIKAFDITLIIVEGRVQQHM